MQNDDRNPFGQDEFAGGRHGDPYGADPYGTDPFGRAHTSGRGGAAGPGRFLDELARLVTDAAGVAQGARREVETAVRAQAERFTGSLDLVSREEFEAMRDVALRARADAKALEERVAALEAKHAGDGKEAGDDSE